MDFLRQKISDNFAWRDLVKLPETLEVMKTKFPVKYKPFHFVAPKLKLGIEVEVENLRAMPDIPLCWTTKEDGSLRNHGMEWVSKPLCNEEITFAVNWLFQTLPEKVDFSERTSIHIHVNYRNRTLEELFNTMLLYIVFEKLFYKFAGPERYNNIFCVPIRETKLPIVLSNFLANGQVAQLLQGWAKYSGLNLLPLRTYGTIEFRHMIGHRDVDLLLNWINIIQRLVICGSTKSFMDLFNQIKVLNSTSMYEQFLFNVFKEQNLLFNRDNLQKDMEYGVSIVKAIQPPSPFLKQLIEDISNDSPLLKSLAIDETKTKKGKRTNKIPAPDEAIYWMNEEVLAPVNLAQEGQIMNVGNVMYEWRGGQWVRR